VGLELTQLLTSHIDTALFLRPTLQSALAPSLTQPIDLPSEAEVDAANTCDLPSEDDDGADSELLKDLPPEDEREMRPSEPTGVRIEPITVEIDDWDKRY
jgi:hypothetical protein